MTSCQARRTSGIARKTLCLLSLFSLLPNLIHADESNAGTNGVAVANLVDAQQVQSALTAQWAGYQSEIVSAEIEYTSLHFQIKSQIFTPEQFQAALAKIDFLRTDDADRALLARQLMQTFCPERLEAKESVSSEGVKSQAVAATSPLSPQRRKLLLQGRERRCTTPQMEHVLTEDLHLLAAPSNSDVKAFRRGNCPYWFEGLEWFRTVPHEVLFKSCQLNRVAATQAALPHSSGDLWRLDYVEKPETHGSRVFLDVGDGLPRRWELVSPQSGNMVRLELYHDYVTFPGNVLCPTVRVEADFKQNKATSVQLTVIEQAKFNQPLSADAFRLTAAKGWGWFDWQEPDHHSGVWPQAVADVAAFFRNRTRSVALTQEASTGSSPVRSWRSLLLLLNGGVLVVVGIVLWRRSP
ncbi:hypothetical protein SAMN05421753_107170 [Planctomicrobium piriforme]|uniref:Uncharacterized protein n=1 Tax=Planctomicrobium piriforme TaxID=1576369 RepID=A0A1I3GY62_9PLAN|nr:hypothetical protein SAMN05421753_107170 [Planctomicrobium piriforme]